MWIEDQDTQPLPIVRVRSAFTETSQERFRRLKAVSDATGVRLLFVYLIDERSQQTFGFAPASRTHSACVR